MNRYIGGKQTCEILGVHMQTLYNWEREGKIETIRHSERGKRFYNVEKYLNDNKKKTYIDIEKDINELSKDDNKKLNICYIRVSTISQKDDLERQKEYMIKKYKDYDIIEDIGSGINFNRRGLRRIINLAITGKINKLVVAHKDRLTRFGFELIEDLIKEYSGGKIIIVEKKEDKTAEEEMAIDVLQIMNVFTAKMNGKK